jgi:hypothetical protein
MLAYFSIFKTGSNCDANSFIYPRGGNVSPIDLSSSINETKDRFIFNPANELMDNCNNLHEDISRYKTDEE